MTSNVKYRFVEVVWLDANRSLGWTLAGEMPQPAKCVSRGWVWQDDAAAVVLYSTITESDPVEYGETIAIPKGMVVSMKELPA